MLTRPLHALVVALICTGGCMSIAGIDGDYRLGDGTGAGTTAAGTGTGTANTGGSSAGGSTATGGQGNTGGQGAQAGTGGTGGTGGTPTGTGGSGGEPPPVWTLVETIAVSCDGTVYPSNTVLDNGVTYQLHASGECICTGTTGCDAEWLDFVSPVTNAFSGDVDMGIAIDDTSVDLNRLPDWGPYNATHLYQVDWVGAGSTITAQYHDPNWTNNTGTLSLEIWALQ